MPQETIEIILLIILLICLIACLFLLFKSKRSEKTLTEEIEILSSDKNKLITEKQNLTQQLSDYSVRFQPIIDVDAEKLRISQQTGELHLQYQQYLSDYQSLTQQKQVEISELDKQIVILKQELSLLEETANLQNFGFYKPRYNFDSSVRYQIQLERIRNEQKSMITNKTAAVCHTVWTVNNSVVEGRKQINQTLKLILRAFNGECDAAIAKVKYNNVKVMEARIMKAYEALNKLVTIQRCELQRSFLNLKLEELYLVHEYQEKIYEEKEEQRRIREQMREEEIARREIDKALQEAERDEERYASALRKAREEVEVAVGAKQAKLYAQIDELQKRLIEAQTNKDRAMSRAQMTRSGHVYIISNIGSFGEHVYKIGMTRRLDPMDRVHELGGASVPFSFDVHAVIYSEDAPTLENELHRTFHNCRVNQINYRKEFFKVNIEEIAEVVRKFNAEIEFTILAEAKDYRKTLALVAENSSTAIN